MWLKIILSILLIIFQLGDIYLSEKVLNNGGVELNPFIKKYGYWIKIPGTVFSIAAGILVHTFILVPVCIIMAGVCVYNYRVLRTM